MHFLTINTTFEVVMFALVTANVVCLALVHYDMAPSLARSLAVVGKTHITLAAHLLNTMQAITPVNYDTAAHGSHTVLDVPCILRQHLHLPGALQANYVFVGAFTLEMVLKIAALGLKGYWVVRGQPAL